MLQSRLLRGGAVWVASVLGSTAAIMPLLVPLWLGPEFVAAGLAAQIFTIAVAINLWCAPLAFIAFAEGQHRIAAASAVANLIVNAVGSLLLTMTIGFYGALIGSILGNVFGAGILVFLGRARLDSWMAPPWRALLFAATSAGVFQWMARDVEPSWPAVGLVASIMFLAVAAVGMLLERVPLSALIRMRKGAARH